MISRVMALNTSGFPILSWDDGCESNSGYAIWDETIKVGQLRRGLLLPELRNPVIAGNPTDHNALNLWFGIGGSNVPSPIAIKSLPLYSTARNDIMHTSSLRLVCIIEQRKKMAKKAQNERQKTQKTPPQEIRKAHRIMKGLGL